LCSTLEEVVRESDVILVGTKVVSAQTLRGLLRPDQTVIDLVNLDPAKRLDGDFDYEGICW
jgi:hypothetical protein